VSLANLIDTLIDYPQAKNYSFDLFDSLCQLNILTDEKVTKYKQHVLNLLTEEEEEEGWTKDM
jgi:hypothetical protein